MDDSPRSKGARRLIPSVVFDAYEQNVSALKRYVRGLIQSTSDVDDVVQEAFLRAYSAEQKREIRQPKSYLFRAARNIALNQQRHKSNHPCELFDDLDSPNYLVAEGTLDDDIIAQEKLSIHCAAIATLPPKCRKVYLMRRVYGMSYKEIATTLGVTVNTVEKHMEIGFARCDTYIEQRLHPVAGSDHRSPRTKEV